MLSNNLNQSGFSYRDLYSFSAENVFGLFGSGKSMPNSASGITTTSAGGVNYSQTIGKNKELQLTGSYTLIRADNNVSKTTATVRPLSGELSNTENLLVGESSERYSKGSLLLQYNKGIEIEFKSTIDIGDRNDENLNHYSSVNENSTTLNTGRQIFRKRFHEPVFYNELWMQRSLKKSQAVNLYLTTNSSLRSSTENNLGTVAYPAVNNIPVSVYDQTSGLRANAFNLDEVLTYSLPLNQRKRITMSLHQRLAIIGTTSDKSTFQIDSVTGVYNILLPDQTNLFHTDLTKFNFGITLWKKLEKISYWLRPEITSISQKLEFSQITVPIKRSSLAFVPEASVIYNAKSGKDFGVTVNSNVSLPTPLQLQPVFNNANPLFLVSGNPSLKNSRVNNLFFHSNYSKINGKLYINSNLNLFKYYNNFSFNIRTDQDTKVQTIMPINVQGDYQVAAAVFVGHPLKISGLTARYSISELFLRSGSMVEN